MEIKCHSVSYKYKGKNILSKLSFSLNSSKIYGVFGNYKTLLLEVLDLQKKYKGDIYIDGVLIKLDNTLEFQRQIALISQKDVFYTSSIIDEMCFIMNHYQYSPRDLKKRMTDSLKMVGLSEDYLNRKISTLSSSEKILVKISCAILTNPKVLLFDETFIGLDSHSQKKLIGLIKKLRSKKDKILVIATNDVDLLYELTDEVIILKNSDILCQRDTLSLFKDVRFLEEEGIDIPNLVKFTNLAKKKGVKLSYHRDILDLIKDVYKHV